MAVYESQCKKCQKVHEYISSIAERQNTPKCCGAKTVKIMVAPQISAMVFTGWKGFHMQDGANNGKGTYIESGNDLHRYLKKNNQISASEGVAEAKLQRKNKDEAVKKKRRKDVERVVLQNCR